MLPLHRKCNPMVRFLELLWIFVFEIPVLVVDTPLKLK